MPDAALAQPRILAAPTSPALFLTLGTRGPTDARAALGRLAAAVDLEHAVVGLGQPLVAALGASVPGLRGFEPIVGPGVAWPATQGALWLTLYGGDDGLLLHEARRLLGLLGPGFDLDDATAAYQHREGRDLSGFVDGTENPKGETAVEVALADGPPGLAGGSFVSTQRWVHDLAALDRLSADVRDRMVGRTRDGDEELEDAPEDAHIRRTKQEDVGFLLRRSMPWGSIREQGLVFVAYASSPDTFVRHGRRMVGAEDGIVDALYQVSRPVTGGLYWCPPVVEGRLDLRGVS